MRVSKVRVLSVSLAIAAALLFIWIFPTYILDLGIEPTGEPLRKFYQAQTVADLPESIQTLINYQYPIALLFALSVFGAVDWSYQVMAIAINHSFVILIGCLLPIAIFLFFPLIVLSPFVALGLFIWLIWLYQKFNHALLVPYLCCLALNVIAAIMLWQFFIDVFAATT